jgi:DNA-binding IclR family transcriptional regulator
MVGGMVRARARLRMGVAMAGGSTEWRGRSVISKVVALLDAFTPAAPELSLNELAALTGLPVSTTYRLASELVGWGGLERVEGGGYRIGLRLWEIGSLAPAGDAARGRPAAHERPVRRDPRERPPGRARRHGGAVRGEASGRRAMPVRTRRGGRLPLHATAVGGAAGVCA